MAKAAFGLNQIIHWQSLNDAKSIKECAIIQNTSNTDIDKSIIATMLPVRIKQSSDTQVVENFNRIEHLIATNHDIILKLYEDNVSAKDEATKILRHVSENTISELCAHNSRCLKQIDDLCIQLHGDHDAFVHDAGII